MGEGKINIAARTLHWEMNKCNPDITQGGRLKVKVETNVIETVHLQCIIWKGRNLTNAESGAVSNNERE